jgi:hypothetical protein
MFTICEGSCAPHRRFTACRILPDAESARTASARVGADMGCGQDGNGRRSGALFGARPGELDRRLGCGRRHPQHRLPRAALYALQSGQAASVLAPVAAPGNGTSGLPGRSLL